MAGASQQFTATGTYSDGSTQNVTSQAAWTSSNPSVATINTNGLANAVAAGATTVTASLAGVTGSTLLTVQTPRLAITSTSFPTGVVNTAYSATLTATGGTVPYTWSIARGSMPPGLTLNSNSAVISGTPTAAGAFNFTAQVRDASNPVQSATQALSITLVASSGASGTIGNTSDGTSTDGLWDSGAWINACRFQAASNMTVSTMSAKVAAISGHYKCAIYTDANSQPSRFLRSTAEVSNPTNGWQAFPLTASLTLTNGQFYWLAIWSDNSGARVYYSDTKGTLRWGRYDYGSWPDPIATTGGGSLDYCIYATGAPKAQGAALLRPKVTITGNGPFLIRSEGIPGNTYRIEYTDTLSNPVWHALTTAAADDSGVVECTDSPPQGLPARYYRSVGL